MCNSPVTNLALAATVPVSETVVLCRMGIPTNAPVRPQICTIAFTIWDHFARGEMAALYHLLDYRSITRFPPLVNGPVLHHTHASGLSNKIVILGFCLGVFVVVFSVAVICGHWCDCHFSFLC